MTVKLSSLRVTAEVNAEQYVRGMAQKVAADEAAIASSRKVSQALAAQDAASEKTEASVKRISRSWVDGYGSAARFEAAVREVGKAMDKGLDMGRAIAALDGIYRKFGQVASSVDLAKQGFVSVAPAVEALNRHYEITAINAERAAVAARNLSTAQAAQASINQRLGVREIQPGSARASAEAFLSPYGGIDAVAAMRADSIAKAFGDRLSASLVAATSKSARESASVFQLELERLDEIARMKAAEAGAAFNSDLNRRFGIGSGSKSARGSASVFTENDSRQKAEFAAFVTEQQKYEQIRGRIVQSHLPESAEMKRTADLQAEILELGRRRLLTQNEVNAALVSEDIRHKQSLESIRGMHIAQGKYASGVGLARYEVINLSRQLQDVVVSLQGGQAPMTVLLQQGTQIADIFAASSANIGAVARQAGSWALSAIFSMKGLVAGTLAAGAAGAYAGYQFAEGQREVERALSGVGKASGVTVAQVNAIAEATARGSRVSVASARDMATAFAATGNIGAGIIPGLSGAVKGYSVQTGQDLTKSYEELAAAFADPIKGAETLNSKLGFLDARTRDHIRTLIEQNNTSGAQRVLLDSVTKSVGDAADRVSWLSKAWDSVKNSASDAFDAVGRALGGQQTLQQQLEYAVAAQASRRGNTGLKAGTASGRALAERGDDAIYNLQEQIRLQGRLQAEQARTAQIAKLSLAVEDIARATEPEIEALRKINEELAKTDKLIASVEGRNAFGDDARLGRVAERLRNAQGTFLTPEQRLARTGELTVQSIMARSLSERMAVELSREELSIAGQKLSNEERRLTLANKMLEVQTQANREARDALRTANDNYSLAGLNPYQRMRREQEILERENRLRFGNSTSAPTSVPSVNGSTAPGMNGLNQSFADQLTAFIAAASAEGLKLSITSGYRSIEQQAKLYAEKPHLAAPPGRSNHNFGLAADLGFGPGAKEWAHANAARFGLSFPMANRPFNPEAWHVEPINARAMRGSGEQVNAAATVRQTNELAWTKNQFADAIRNSSDRLREENAALELLEKQSGMTAFQIGRMKKEQELTNSFTAAGIPITDEMRKGIAKMADEYGRLAERQASVRFTQDALFERSQLGRTPGEQQIASRLRGSGVGEDSAVADMFRMNQMMSDLKDTSGDALKGFLSDLRQGKTLMEALNNVANKLLDKVANSAVDMLMAGLFKGSGVSGNSGMLGNLFSGFFGSSSAGSATSGLYANGASFGMSGVHPFALGAAFTNSIVSKPTLFPFANGIGLMGEAGDEAIMPLKRDAKGRLGVHTSGGANDNRSGGANVKVQVIDQAGVSKRTERSRNSNGDELIKVILSRVDDGLTTGEIGKGYTARHGLSPKAVRR